VVTLPIEITAVNDPPEIRLVPGGVLRLAEVSCFYYFLSNLEEKAHSGGCKAPRWIRGLSTRVKSLGRNPSIRYPSCVTRS